MSVSGRHFVGHDQLDTGIESCGDLGTSAQSRILKNEDAPLRLLGGDQGTCLKDGSADVLEPPERRHALALGLWSDQRVHNRPKRGHVLLIDPGIECLTLWRLSRGIHGALQDVKRRWLQPYLPQSNRAAPFNLMLIPEASLT